ncbi:tumor protein D54-like isoform X1 [Mytilus californianus]|uniref:tumor protein D54-like isoform X1 n=1 Tax=Mytilus californianus TaxID=6549 RepID=UPI002246A2B0|nr:tumor protein D54-like isoform X1 [Mytilus californianus]
MESYPNPEDLEYEPKISESTNYLKFLKLTHDGHHSEDEGHYDSEGYYEDDIVGDIVRTESDREFLFSDLPEVDEHLYDSSLNSPSYETVETGTEPVPVIVETPEERAERLKVLQEELEKVEEEIVTLRQVLGAKVRRAAEIKRQMGITPFQEFKQDLQHGFKSIQDSDAMQKTNERLTHMKERITSTSAYQKTNEKIHDINDKITHSTAYQKTSSAVKTASEKTSAAFTTVGSTVSRKLSDVRNSTAFKSMEEKVGGAVANVKAKVAGSKSENNFEDALIEETKGANSESAESKPDEKIPL